ncbi:hypothetical protein JTE90_007557 [Oedothorax gibbosus]|uniref:Cytochrome P450 n=1 Tax=Oedothorax gibbosus TaxID=931172 RepID=A0AAV6VNK4_9ARAC|nr:hypothetical protein JTE90_007557 [Oedothorax gibbosus]
MGDILNVWSIILGIFILSVSVFWWQKKRKYHLPNGPWSLPIVGYLPFLGEKPYKDFEKLSKKHGKVFGLYMGPDYTLVLNDYESVKEAFSNNALLDRPDHLFDFNPAPTGFTSANGEEWMEQRRYSMKTLKDIGLSKNPWETNLEVEIEDFLNLLESKAGNPVDISHELLASVSNSMTSIVLGKRLMLDDPRRVTVDKGIEAVIESFGQNSVVTIFPNFMKFICKLGLTRWAEIYRNLDAFKEFFRNAVEERKKVFPNQKEDNYIDGYLEEMSKAKATKSYFNEDNLIGSAETMVMGGSDTSKNSLMWIFLAMAAYPDVQKKIQDEIDRELGRDGKLPWMQRTKLPYTYAATLEVQRWKTTAPLGVFRRANTDTKLGEFDIPKGTNVLGNFWLLHNDPKYWKEPDSFIPERFLDSEGNLLTLKPESYIPFSIGRRNCPGEFVALIEIFRYFTAIMQRFHIRPLENKPPILEGLMKAVYAPIPQKLRFIPRE